MFVAKKPEFQSKHRPTRRALRLRAQHPKIATNIEKEFGVSKVAARVLAARGFECGDLLKKYLEPNLKEGLPEPGKLKNLEKACDLIESTVKNGGGIAICCDFDVDGLSGGAQVQHFFMENGVTSRVFVPDRFKDGYGLNEKMIQDIAAMGLSLIITIDFGTTNSNELCLARSLGLKTIVIDHHHVGSAECPADVFVNPNQKGCGFADKILSASGLAWYLLLGLKGRFDKKVDARTYLDLACLGTICDMVPLIGANRVIAKRGLELLSKTNRVGLLALKNAIGINGSVGCSHVSFGIGPRLNAAGRMIHGEMVIELLTTSDSAKAQKLASKLNKLNLDRQETEASVLAKAIRQLEFYDEIPEAIVVWDKSFHTGVVGIVAQRLVELYYKPTVVLGLDSDGVFKGSARGVKGVSVVDTLASVSSLLIKYGGHEGAGGLSIEEKRLKEFALAYIAECKMRVDKSGKEACVDVDTEVTLDELDFKLIEELKSFAPFGMSNPGPTLLAKNLKVTEVRPLKGGTHLKATFTDGKRYIQGVFWRQSSHPHLLPGLEVNIAFKPDTNDFGGVSEVQAVLVEVERV